MTEAKKKYNLKTVSARHIAPLASIITKIGIKEVAQCFKAEGLDKETDVKQLGMAIVIEISSVVLSHLEQCADDVYSLLADLAGLTFEEVLDMPIDEFTEVLIDVCTAQEFRQAFTAASRLLK